MHPWHSYVSHLAHAVAKQCTVQDAARPHCSLMLHAINRKQCLTASRKLWCDITSTKQLHTAKSWYRYINTPTPILTETIRFITRYWTHTSVLIDNLLLVWNTLVPSNQVMTTCCCVSSGSETRFRWVWVKFISPVHLSFRPLCETEWIFFVNHLIAEKVNTSPHPTRCCNTLGQLRINLKNTFWIMPQKRISVRNSVYISSIFSPPL